MAESKIFNLTIKTLLVFAVIVCISNNSISQVCNGNLGENIFTDGDFGRGNSNILQSDPLIAPGYNYNALPPPTDGEYLLTNNTGNWLNIFGNWLKIEDNSEDPKGYMMVVNADYDPGLFYRKVIDGLCENTLYAFSADIINLIMSNSNMIKPDVSFLLDGVVKYNTGQIINNEQWNTYGFTFITEPGQNSITLSLQNNAPGGLGNDLALDNISFRPCGPEALILPVEIANICEDGTSLTLVATIVGNAFDTTYIQWQQSFNEGLSWQNVENENGISFVHDNFTAGYYYYRYLVANQEANLSSSKCRVVSNEKIVRVIPKFNFITDTICHGLGYTVGNNTYTETGIFVDSLINILGCDSIITLDLTVPPEKEFNYDFTLNNPSCSYVTDGYFSIDSIHTGNSPYVFIFNNEDFSDEMEISGLSEGVYNFTLTDSYGCIKEDAVELISPPEFYVDLGPDLQIEMGDYVHIIPNTNFPVDNYIWMPSEPITCNPDCNEINWVPTSSLLISTIATSTNKCISTDSVYIEVTKTRRVFMPNAFTPNNDGINDYFTVMGQVPNIKKVKKLIVFDRWGNQIFENNDFSPNIPSNGWDGTYKGAVLQTGSFVYIADIIFIDNELITYKGVINLIR